MCATPHLVMFDLDGTLVETGPEIAAAVNDTLRHFALPSAQQELVNGWIGSGTSELLVQALAFSTQSTPESVRCRADFPEIKKQFDIRYQHHCGTVSVLYPSVREVIAELKKRGVKLAIVTNKEMRYTKIVLNAHQLTNMFDLVVSGDSFPTKKPDPYGVRHCLAFFKVQPEHALFIGDSSIDAATAKSADVPVWLLTYGYNMNRRVEDSHPDRVIESLQALL